MKILPLQPDLKAVIRRTIWFKSPEEACELPDHLIAHILTYGTHEDVSVLKKYISFAELKTAIENAPAGIFDPRSWAYWNLKIGKYPAPALPMRKL